MIKGSVASIESMGLADGPGIRTVVFLNGCKLRCKYCHNPEMQEIGNLNITPSELCEKIKRNKSYFKRNNGGVTFSGGEPLLQKDFLIECFKILKSEKIHIALDTSGVGNGDYEEILSYVDLILFDIKHVTSEGYHYITSHYINDSLKFIDVLNNLDKKVWIRQVIVPSIMDNTEYIDKLVDILLQIKNVEKVDFLPYHKLGETKYEKLKKEIPFKTIEAMDEEKCNKLYNEFLERYQEKGGKFLE